MADCPFCAISAGGDALVHVDADVAVFLDIRPVFKGHLLVVPRRHVVTLDALPTELLAPLFGELGG